MDDTDLGRLADLIADRLALKLSRAAAEAASRLLGDPRTRHLLRELVLLESLERERQRETGAVRTFLQECEFRGVKLSLREDGEVMVTHKERLGPDLRAVWVMYRPAITAHLERMRALEEARERALGPDIIPLKENRP